jgi:hypothetical protein
MNQRTRATAEPKPTVRYRIAKARDSLALWRLRRQKSGDESMSPFFYMTVLRRLADYSVVAEEAGEVVGFVLARPGERRSAIRVMDLVVDPTRDTAVLTAGLLARLVRLPAHAAAEYIDAEHGARDALGKLFADVGDAGHEEAEGMPLAPESGDRRSQGELLTERTRSEESWLESR